MPNVPVEGQTGMGTGTKMTTFAFKTSLAHLVLQFYLKEDKILP